MPEGFAHYSVGSHSEITCQHPGCHKSTAAASLDSERAKEFFEHHNKLHGRG